MEIFPIYEEVEHNGHILPRVKSELRYLKSLVPDTETDPYDVLRKGKRYLAWVQGQSILSDAHRQMQGPDSSSMNMDMGGAHH